MWTKKIEIKDIMEDYDLRTDPRLVKEQLEYGVSGIYAFEDAFTGELYYVGRATNLTSRMREHRDSPYHKDSESSVSIKDLLNDDRLLVSICKVPKELLAITEVENIDKYKPTLNVVKS